MRLRSELIQLPLQFDATRLAHEVEQLGESAWYADPHANRGHSALVLVSPNGAQNNDYEGGMQCSEELQASPYLQQILASFNTVVGRSRLIRIDPGCEISPHFDSNPSWRHRVRIDIPIVTSPDVTVSSGANFGIHMQAGEAWIIDRRQTHAFYNKSGVRSIHLVVDTQGSSGFWQLIAQGQAPNKDQPGWREQIKNIAYDRQASVKVRCERFNQTTVFSVDQMELLLQEVATDLQAWRQQAPDAYLGWIDTAQAFLQDWRTQWSLYADTIEGLPHYSSLLHKLKIDAARQLAGVTLDSNQAPASEVLIRWLNGTIDSGQVSKKSSALVSKRREPRNSLVDTSLFDAPIFIVAAPRSGSTLLFESLQKNRELWTLGDESHQVFESIKALHPASKRFESNELSADDCNAEVGAALMGGFIRRLRNSHGTMFSQIPPETQSSNVRFLEKTPKNALRIPFLRKLFPKAMFIYLHRQAEPNIGSIMDAWNSGRFVTYPNLPNWSGQPWSLLLPTGWKRFEGRPLAEIAAWQWAQTNAKIIRDLDALKKDNVHVLDYQGFLDDREAALQQICQFADIPFGPKMQALAKQELPHSKYTLSTPSADKWKRHQQEITLATEHVPEVEQVRKMIHRLKRQ